jgi:hypothetical protein
LLATIRPEQVIILGASATAGSRSTSNILCFPLVLIKIRRVFVVAYDVAPLQNLRASASSDTLATITEAITNPIIRVRFSLGVVYHL